MKIAALQMVSEPDVRANLDQAMALLRQAREQGAELAALPEYFCAMGLRDTDKPPRLIRTVRGSGPDNRRSFMFTMPNQLRVCGRAASMRS